MKKLKILLVIGTRPEGIKLFPVYKELRKSPELFQPIVVATGQHEELASQVFKFFDFKPDFSFGVMQKNQTLSTLTLKLIPLLTDCFLGLEPDIVLVQGDTTSAFIASLAAYYAKVRLGHVEAGLRTHYKFNPYPEEMNRTLISQLAGFHFAPTETAKQNLLQENVRAEDIFVTGNTIVDVAKDVLEHNITPDMDKLLPQNAEDQAIILVTAHRRENFGQPLKNIRLALSHIAETSKKFLIILMMHPNPNVKEAFEDINNGGEISNIKVLPPLCYPEFLFYMTKAFLILTDSGGLVEEASILGKPVLIMREVTERPESVKAGIAEIVGTNPAEIFRQTLHLYSCKKDYNQMAQKKDLYGDGYAAEKIAEILSELNWHKYYVLKKAPCSLPPVEIQRAFSETEKFGKRFSGSALSKNALASFCCHLPKNKPIRLLELGAGLSTIFWHFLIQQLKSDFKVTTFEHHPHWVKYVREKIAESCIDLRQLGLKRISADKWEQIFSKPEVALNLWPSIGTPIIKKKEFEDPSMKNTFYDLTSKMVTELGSIDAMIVDGPHGNGRSLAFPLLYQHLKPGTLLLIDDFDHYEFLKDLGRIFNFEIIEKLISEIERWTIVKLSGYKG